LKRPAPRNSIDTRESCGYKTRLRGIVMGNFYINYTLKGPTQKAVAAALAKRTAIVTPVSKGCVVVYDQQSDEDSGADMDELADDLSSKFDCAVIAVDVHDDDILMYFAYKAGEKIDAYCSHPNYFNSGEDDYGNAYSDDDEDYSLKDEEDEDSDDEDSDDENSDRPAGGDAEALCRAFGSTNVRRVSQILRKRDYVFATDRHGHLCEALALPTFAVGASYEYITRGDIPDGLSKDDLMYT
jgi:hypothetical protein